MTAAESISKVIVVSISQTELAVITQKTVSLFNRLRSPEAVAKVVIVLPDAITIAFSGSFCYECGGVVGYVEEFVHDFKVLNSKVELKPGKTRQTSPRSFEVTYLVRPR